MVMYKASMAFIFISQTKNLLEDLMSHQPISSVHFLLSLLKILISICSFHGHSS